MSSPSEGMGKTRTVVIRGSASLLNEKGQKLTELRPINNIGKITIREGWTLEPIKTNTRFEFGPWEWEDFE